MCLMTSIPSLPVRNPGTKETDSVLVRDLCFCGKVYLEASYGQFPGDPGCGWGGGRVAQQAMSLGTHEAGDAATPPWSLSRATSSPGTGRSGQTWEIQSGPCPIKT